MFLLIVGEGGLKWAFPDGRPDLVESPVADGDVYVTEPRAEEIRREQRTGDAELTEQTYAAMDREEKVDLLRTALAKRDGDDDPADGLLRALLAKASTDDVTIHDVSDALVAEFRARVETTDAEAPSEPSNPTPEAGKPTSADADEALSQLDAARPVADGGTPVDDRHLEPDD